MLMKSVKFLIISASLMMSTVANSADLEEDMETLSRSYGLFIKASTVPEAVSALERMHAAASDARLATPDSVFGEPANSPKMQEYRAGLNALLASIDKAKAAAQAGKLDQAKLEVKTMANIQMTYHRKFRQ